MLTIYAHPYRRILSDALYKREKDIRRDGNRNFLCVNGACGTKFVRLFGNL